MKWICLLGAVLSFSEFYFLTVFLICFPVLSMQSCNEVMVILIATAASLGAIQFPGKELIRLLLLSPLLTAKGE